jgi:hypothetical protein
MSEGRWNEGHAVMNHDCDPGERFRWEEERRKQERREDLGPVEGEGVSREVGDPRWGTGGMRVHEAPHPLGRDERREPLGPPSLGPERAPSAARAGAGYSAPFDVESTRGPYVGIGPRGYRRSDERIHEDVCVRFAEHGQLDPSDVEVAVIGGEVILSGAVATRTQKRLAEDIADSVFGVVEVQNHLRVRRASMGALAPPARDSFAPRPAGPPASPALTASGPTGGYQHE